MPSALRLMLACTFCSIFMFGCDTSHLGPPVPDQDKAQIAPEHVGKREEPVKTRARARGVGQNTHHAPVSSRTAMASSDARAGRTAITSSDARADTTDVWEELSDPKSIFWKGYIQVVGESAPGQIRSMAELAARGMAYGRLVEILVGLAVERETVIRESAVDRDTLTEKVKGVVKMASQCGMKYDKKERSAVVCLRLHLASEHTDPFIQDIFEHVSQQKNR